MEIYILIMFLALLVAWVGKNKAIYWGFFLVLMVISTFRGIDVGGDTEYYQWAFEDTEAVRGVTIKSFEYGYLFLNFAVYHFTDNYTVFLGVVSFLILFPVFFVTPIFSKKYNIVIAFYVLLYNFNFSLCFVRQYIAISILYVGFLLCSSTHKKIYLLITVVLASLFHQTSIFLLILLPFVNLKYHRIFISILIFLSYFIGRLNIVIPFFSQFGIESLYSESLAGEMVFSMNGFIVTSYFAFIAYVSKEDSFLLYTMAIGLVIFNMLVFNTNISRLNWSLSIVQVLVLGNLKMISFFQKKETLCRFFSYAYAITLYIIFLLANQGKVVPYEFIPNIEMIIKNNIELYFS